MDLAAAAVTGLIEVSEVPAHFRADIRLLRPTGKPVAFKVPYNERSCILSFLSCSDYQAIEVQIALLVSYYFNPDLI